MKKIIVLGSMMLMTGTLSFANGHRSHSGSHGDHDK